MSTHMCFHAEIVLVEKKVPYQELWLLLIIPPFLFDPSQPFITHTYCIIQ